MRCDPARQQTQWFVPGPEKDLSTEALDRTSVPSYESRPQRIFNSLDHTALNTTDAWSSSSECTNYLIGQERAQLILAPSMEFGQDKFNKLQQALRTANTNGLSHALMRVNNSLLGEETGLPHEHLFNWS